MKFLPEPLHTWEAKVDLEDAARWLIKGFVAEDSMTMLSGHPKSLGKKTLLAITETLALASGRTIEAFKPAAQIPVLYCYHEGGRPATRHRIRMLKQGHGIQDSEIRETFFFQHRSLLDLRTPADVKALGSWCRDRGIKFIVLDTLAKSMLGDENSAENMGRVVRGVEDLRGYGMSVMMLHHLQKAQAKLTGGSFDPDHDMRGSGSLAGAYEAHQAVRHYGYNHKKMDLLVQNKDGEEFAHKLWYDFINAEKADGTPDYDKCKTTLHMGKQTSWDEVGLLDYDEVKELMAYISDTSNYTVEMLAALWKVEKNTATELLAKLIQQEQMVSKKYGYGLP